jgi:hypothetical protein
VAVSKNDVLYQLVYVSVASRPFGQQDLVELLESARADNAKLGITGLLLFRDGAFMQALEGPKSQVTGLFEKIKEDERHDCVIVVYEGPIESRSFPDWYMGFKSPSEAEMAKLAGYRSFADLAREPKDPAAASSVARRLLDAFRVPQH